MEIMIATHPVLGIEVNSEGMVKVPKSLHRPEHWTYGWPAGDGYLYVRINKKQYKVHRLILESFSEKDEERPFVDHINRNRRDNRLSNLRWVNRSENNLNGAQHINSKDKYGITQSEDSKQYWKNRARVYRFEKKFGITITIKELDDEHDIRKRD